MSSAAVCIQAASSAALILLLFLIEDKSALKSSVIFKHTTVTTALRLWFCLFDWFYPDVVLFYKNKVFLKNKNFHCTIVLQYATP